MLSIKMLYGKFRNGSFFEDENSEAPTYSFLLNYSKRETLTGVSRIR
jgi:hypothetical protein